MSVARSVIWDQEFKQLAEWLERSPEFWVPSIRARGGIKRETDMSAAWSARDAVRAIYMGRYVSDSEPTEIRVWNAILQAREAMDELAMALRDDLRRREGGV
jgi:hypothetical protein